MAKAAAVDPVCPCGGTRLDDAPRQAPRVYADCCGRHLDGLPAPDAEALMRSRYTAFTRGDEAYLLATWHESHRPADVATEPGTRWLGLEVRAHHRLDAQHATVEFVARMRHPGGQASRLHERSRFLREADGRWYYLDGEQQ